MSPETGVAKDRGHGFSTVLLPRLNMESPLRGASVCWFGIKKQGVSKRLFFHEFWMIDDIWKCSSVMSDLIMTYLYQSVKPDRFSRAWAALVTTGCPLGPHGHFYTTNSIGRNSFRKTKACLRTGYVSMTVRGLLLPLQRMLCKINKLIFNFRSFPVHFSVWLFAFHCIFLYFNPSLCTCQYQIQLLLR